MALGMTVLLSFSVFMLLIAENMPATSFYIPLIGQCGLLFRLQISSKHIVYSYLFLTISSVGFLNDILELSNVNTFARCQVVMRLIL